MTIGSYGADQSGLIYGYVFSADGVGRPLNTDQAADWLARRHGARNEFVWLHFNAAHTGATNWIRQHLDAPPEFADALKSGSKSTRIEQTHDCLLAVINDVVYNLLEESAIQAATLWLSIRSDVLLSVRNRPLRSVDRLREAVNARECFATTLALVIHLLRDQADVLVQIMRAATDRVDSMEDNFFSDRLPARAELGGLRRDLVRMQRLLAPEPAALFRLLNRPPEWISPVDAQDLRQSTEEFSVVLSDLAGLQERIKLLQEEVVAHIGERTNRSVFVLTAVTVTALPINLVAGLFGMNVGGVPFNQEPLGFWIVVGSLVVVTWIAAWRVFRRPQ